MAIKSRRCKVKNGNRNDVAPTGHRKEQFFSARTTAPPEFVAWLRSLECSPHLRLAVAKTPRKIARYERALCQWKQAGYPHPGDWPDNGDHRVNPYTDLWVGKSLKNGFLSNKKALRSGAKTIRKDSDFLNWLSLLGDLIVNLVLYVDESGTHDQTGQQPQSQVASVAGYVAKPESWLKFQKDWGRFLSKHVARVFHFTDLKVAQRRAEEGNPVLDPKHPYFGWDAKQCESFLMEGATIIASGKRIPVCGDADIFGVANARKSDPTIVGPKNPQEAAVYWFYSSALRSVSAEWPEFGGKIGFIFEHCSNHQWTSAISRIHYEWRSDPRVGTLGFEKKEDQHYYGLQAADLVAGRLRHITRIKKGYEANLSGPLSDLDRILFQKFGPKTYEDLLKLRTSR